MPYWKVRGKEGFDRAYPSTIEADELQVQNGTLVFLKGVAVIAVISPSGYSECVPSDRPIKQSDYFVGEK
jgi:hypothetical protein